MQTIGTKTPSAGSGQGERDPGSGPRAPYPDLVPLLAGAAVAAGAAGAVLALLDLSTPARAPLTLFFLLAAPGFAIAHWLRGLEARGRAVAAAAGAIAVNLLVAPALLALHVWSVRGGVAAVAGLSAAIFLSDLARRRRHRAPRRRT
ncbi:hypothetical protein [Streptomyces sp. G45]|uniref:hypothetical protein n=1 Tax=Streptomyces sp. G45 TaxID=3406627 RepID=UPI003C241262